MNTHVEHEDLTLYATGAVDAAEMQRIRRHVDSCVTCRNELQRIYGDLGLLAIAVEEESPSADLKQRLMRSIAEEERKSRPAIEKSPSRIVWWRWAAFAAILLLVVVGGLQWSQNERLRSEVAAANQRTADLQVKSDAALKIVATMKAPDALRLSLMKAGEKPQPQLQAVYSVSQARVVLIANDLAPLPPGKAYELWILPVSGNPVAAGVFHPDAKGHADHTFEFKSPVEGKGFAITVEGNEGSSAPTSQPIFVGLKE